MGVSAEIYLATSTSPQEVAAVLARVVPGASVQLPTDGEDAVVELAPDGALRRLGGPVGENYLSGALEPEDIADEEHLSVDDAYPVLWELEGNADGEETVRRSAMALFELLAEHLPCPLLLTFDVDTLLMASLPGEGLTLFADDVTPYAEDRSAWARFRQVSLSPLDWPGGSGRP